MMRKHFQLPRVDIETLEASSLQWEAIFDGAGRWLLIYRRPLPIGFNISHTDVGLAIPPSYPDAQIDSVLFHPCPGLLSGSPLSHVTDYRLDGRVYQHFCRHRTNSNQWRPGLDDIASHLGLVDAWLLKALGRI